MYIQKNVKVCLTAAFCSLISIGVTMSAFADDAAAAAAKNKNLRVDLLGDAVSSVGGGVSAFGGIVSSVTVIAVSLAFLFFFWNLFQYIRANGDDQKDEAKSKMGWAVLAIIIITSLWGIIAFVRSVIGIGQGESNDIPLPGVDFKTPGSSASTGTDADADPG